jgi:hypothetical protein
MARSSTWSGWIGFAGWLMIIIGSIDFFEGLIAVIRDQYYMLAPNQMIVFDLTRRPGRVRVAVRCRLGSLVRDHRRQSQLHRPARVCR